MSTQHQPAPGSPGSLGLWPEDLRDALPPGGGVAGRAHPRRLWRHGALHRCRCPPPLPACQVGDSCQPGGAGASRPGSGGSRRRGTGRGRCPLPRSQGTPGLQQGGRHEHVAARPPPRPTLPAAPLMRPTPLGWGMPAGGSGGLAGSPRIPSLPPCKEGRDLALGPPRFLLLEGAWKQRSWSEGWVAAASLRPSLLG